MKTIFKITTLLLIIFFFNSCVTGIYETVRGYDNYIETNVSGRKELKKKNFKDSFKSEMTNRIDCKNVYYNFYENQEINYKRHRYLIFYKTGQFAYFSSELNDINLDDLDGANFVGYYNVKGNKLILETPTGNFNTAHYRVLWQFKMENNSLIRNEKGINKHFKDVFEVDENIAFTRKEQPNW